MSSSTEQTAPTANKDIPTATAQAMRVPQDNETRVSESLLKNTLG